MGVRLFERRIARAEMIVNPDRKPIGQVLPDHTKLDTMALYTRVATTTIRKVMSLWTGPP
jgi:hypothetical protein